MLHKYSDIQSKKIGEGTNIWQFCVILPGACIGSHCNICANVFIENDVIIGNKVTIKSGVQVWDGVTIEDDVFIGPNVTFSNDLLPRSKQYPDKFISTVIKKGASIGANATIVAGNNIGAYAMIGAGAVITKNIQDYELWVGNPARHVGYITKAGDLLDLELKSKKFGIQYIIRKDEIVKDD